jgi:Family of unknown function (DUF6390)
LNTHKPTSGEVLFARYAYPPNELGYCGTGDGRELLEAAAGVATEDIGRSARHFDGAWPYLEVIAAATGNADPLAAAVVEAYWVGNDLLNAVDPTTFAAVARQHFGDQTGADWHCLTPSAAPPPLPHHSFHVFAIYPWTGLLRQGRGGPALHVLDRCRVRWAEVVATEGDQVRVRCQPLAWDGRSLTLGPPTLQEARWTDQGRSLMGPVSPGDVVSLHWDWVCDTLSETQLASLQHFTARQLAATNASWGQVPTPGSPVPSLGSPGGSEPLS